MAMKEPRYFFGDLRLWKTGRHHVIDKPRGSVQVYEGVDATHAEVLPASPNFKTMAEVITLFDPYADASGRYTRVSFRSCVDAMVDALIARSEARHTLCYVDDINNSSVVSGVSGSGPYTITTGTAHNLIVGDKVLIRRLGVDLYTIASVATAADSTHFTVATQSHTIAISDNVHRIDQYWQNLVSEGPNSMKFDRDRNWFGDECVYRFTGKVPSTATYRRLTVNLDA